MNQKGGEAGSYGQFYDNKRHAQLKRISASESNATVGKEITI